MEERYIQWCLNCLAKSIVRPDPTEDSRLCKECKENIRKI